MNSTPMSQKYTGYKNTSVILNENSSPLVWSNRLEQEKKWHKMNYYLEALQKFIC